MDYVKLTYANLDICTVEKQWIHIYMHILDTTDWYLVIYHIFRIVHTVHVYIYICVYIYMHIYIHIYMYTVYCCRYSIYHIYYVKFIQRTYLPLLYILHLLWIQDILWYTILYICLNCFVSCTVYIYMYTYIYIQYIYIYTYLSVCIYIYIHIYIYTHTHQQYMYQHIPGSQDCTSPLAGSGRCSGSHPTFSCVDSQEIYGALAMGHPSGWKGSLIELIGRSVEILYPLVIQQFAMEHHHFSWANEL